jgi:hypothetical protein
MATYTPNINLLLAQTSDQLDLTTLVNPNWNIIDQRFKQLITVASSSPSSPLAGDLWYQVV